MSFADELKALALTAPKEKDTEDAFNEDSTAKLTSSATDYETAPSRRKAIALDEGKYGGRTVSRKEMMLENEEFPDEQFELDPDLYDICDEAQDDDEENEEAEGSVEGADETESEEEIPEDSDAAEVDEDHSHLQDEEDSEASEEGGEDLDEESEDADDDEGADYDISQFVNGQSSGTKNNNKDDPFEHLERSVLKRTAAAGDVSEDVRKGLSIGNQLKIWDKLLEYRIQFQRVLALSNQLPPHEQFGAVMKEFLADPENNKLYRQSVKNIEKAFQQLIAIRQELIDLYPEVKKSLEKRRIDGSGADGDEEEVASDDEEIPSDIASGYSENEGDDANEQAQKLRSKKRSRQNEGKESEDDDEATNKKIRVENATPQTSEDFHQKFLAFRNATIEKWYQRTKLGAGNKANKAGYTALEQPPLKQIEHILADQDRLIERTRVKRSQYTIVGLPESSAASDDASEKQILPEIFDDDDFYHHLLREVIERKTQDVSDPFEISRHWIEIQKLRSKMKRRVDTKASKGRRIRYDVIPKLVSFMTPHDAATFSEQARNDLFASLFGKQPATSKAEVRPKVTKNDMVGFKLFS